MKCINAKSEFTGPNAQICTKEAKFRVDVFKSEKLPSGGYKRVGTSFLRLYLCEDCVKPFKENRWNYKIKELKRVADNQLKKGEKDRC